MKFTRVTKQQTGTTIIKVVPVVLLLCMYREKSVEVLAAEDEVVAKVLVTHCRVFGQFFAGALEQDFALKQQIGPVSDAQCLGSVVVGDEDSDVFALKAIDNALDVLHGDGVHTGKRLVKHDESRVDSQTAGNLGAAALATRQSVAQVFAHLLQVKLADELLQAVFLLGGSQVRHFQDGADVVLDT